MQQSCERGHEQPPAHRPELEVLRGILPHHRLSGRVGSGTPGAQIDREIERVEEITPVPSVLGCGDLGAWSVQRETQLISF